MHKAPSSAASRPGGRQSPKSVRLSADEARRVTLAAERLGTTASDLMRDAVLSRCDEVLTDDLALLLADVIGAVDLPDAPAARDSERVFAEGLQQKLARRRRLS